MKKCIAIIILLFALVTANAQTKKDTAQIIKAANDYIEGFYFGDTAKIYYSIDTAASKHGYYKTATDSSYRKIPMSFTGMIRYSKNERNRPTEENAKIRDVKILDAASKIASVKVRAWWGIDYLLLTKTEDRWIVEKILWQSL
ncbi:MAG TPA: nuclear transport factor 2 family protein [Chitinophagaceae bacterium]|nr:nuclear transport factor 2 family protein [Chitinophagaceae bacterium]